MALNVNDPKLRGLWGLDESGATSARVNAAKSNLLANADDHDLQTDSNGTDDGLPTKDDGTGGKAISNDFSPGAPFANQYRWLESSVAKSLADMETDGIVVDPAGWTGAGDGVTMGGRLDWLTFETGSGGGTDVHYLVMVNPDGTELRTLGITLQPDTNITPATGGQLRIWCGGLSDVIEGAAYSTTGSPPTQYITDAGWFRYAIKVEWLDGVNVRIYCVVINETSGAVYTFVSTSELQVSANFTGSQTARSDMRFRIGCSDTVTDRIGHPGYQDEIWIYQGAMSDDDMEETVRDGITIPWVAPTYPRLDQDVRVAHSNEQAAFPVPRQLPIGAPFSRHPAGAWGTRLRLYYENTRPTRPASIRRAAIQWDSEGPRSNKKNNESSYDRITEGLVRQPGQLTHGVVTDVRNFEFSGEAPRRRRGFRIVRDVAESNKAANSFRYWRDKNDQLFGIYKVADKLYYEAGATAEQLATGWNTNQMPKFAVLDGRLIILTPDDQAFWQGQTDGVDQFSVPGPTSGSVASTVGTLTGSYGYAYTFYDPDTGDETAPREVGTVSLTAQGALISSMDTSPQDARFTFHRIYRTTDGGASPSYFFIDSQAIAATYTDSGEADGTLLIPQADGDFLGTEMPETFSGVTVHEQRAFYWTSGTNADLLYWSEANNPAVVWAESRFRVGGPIRCAISTPNGVLVVTDTSTELITSDFIRDTNDAYQVRRTVLSETVGGAGRNCMVDAEGRFMWIDRRGVYEMRGDKPVKLSSDIDNLFRFVNVGLADQFTAGFNHLRRQVWFTVALAREQDDNTRHQTQIVYHLDEDKWTLYDMELCSVGQWDADLNGMLFAGMDQIGTFKELESYEGDGIEDASDTDEITTPEGSITSVSGNVITVSGAAWTTNALRGMGILIRCASDGSLYAYTIKNNTATTITVERSLSASVVADDGYEIGGMRAYFETAERGMGTSNFKGLRFLYTEFDDLTQDRFV
jgi:hypothetical protein